MDDNGAMLLRDLWSRPRFHFTDPLQKPERKYASSRPTEMDARYVAAFQKWFDELYTQVKQFPTGEAVAWAFEQLTHEYAYYLRGGVRVNEDQPLCRAHAKLTEAYLQMYGRLKQLQDTASLQSFRAYHQAASRETRNSTHRASLDDIGLEMGR